ncbi:hypothetical protein BKA93DRAFT_748185 [Sparassis latifolia]
MSNLGAKSRGVEQSRTKSREVGKFTAGRERVGCISEATGWSKARRSGSVSTLAVIPHSLRKYGHEDVKLMFTDNCMYLIPLSEYLQDGFLHLPHTLLVVLRSSQIKKLGVHITGDLTRLFKDCGFKEADISFSGAVELGAMAKDHNAADRTNIGLADLVATVLRRYLAKDTSIRVSTSWDSPALSEHQMKYAALDVYAAWAIFEAFSTIPIGQVITANMAAGTRVKLLSCDRSSTAALGFIAPDCPAQFDGVNVTKI